MQKCYLRIRVSLADIFEQGKFWFLLRKTVGINLGLVTTTKISEILHSEQPIIALF